VIFNRVKRFVVVSTTALVAIVLSSLAQVSAQTQGAAVPPTPVVTGYPMHVPADPKLPTFFLIGDSTVRNGQGDGSNGQWGWGEPFVDFFDSAKINVVNRALGGRSSRTYLSEGHWDQVKAMLKPGDFVLMQFGHNDNGPLDDTVRARGTLKGVSDETREIDNPITKKHEVVHTYGWYLKNYIAEIRAAGATPIVCSPIPRNNWKDGKIVRWEGYDAWAEEAAASEHVLFIPLDEIIARQLDQLGAEKVEPMYVADHVHTVRAGAEFNAASVVSGLKALQPDPVAQYFSEKGKAVARFEEVTAESVRMTLNGKPTAEGDHKSADVAELTLQNGIISITFGPDGTATSVKKNGTELAHNLNGIVPRDPNRNKTWYIDWGGSKGTMVADNIRVIKNTPEMAHIAIVDSGATSDFYIEHHILLMRGESGVYGYVICKNIKHVRLGTEMRTMYRLDRDIFDWAYVSERTGQQPRYADLVKLPNIQDETWQMPDGSIYQKYDYSGYMAENPMWGHYGHGFGVWFIPVSTEYYAGGPLRQDLMVHQDALILNYFQGTHYGAGGPGDFTDDQKLFGPWFTYINTGDATSMIADAKKKALAEHTRWPYPWMDDALYPLNRTTVTGQLKVADGRSAANAMVVLGKPGVEIYKQGGDFMFYANADAEGKFTIPNVRPGNYALYAYATEGSITSQLEKDGVVVRGAVVDLGTVLWTPPKYATLVWQIGKADRMSTEFKFGDQLRNIKWIGMVPADLTYTIGSSKEREDWYYAQGQVGNWDVKFNLDHAYAGTAYLTVAIAGVSNAPHLTISVNGKEVRSLVYANDAATYRAAVRSARYQLEEISFPASLLNVGSNTIRFGMTEVGKNGGIMYDTLKLEVDPSAPVVQK
jgi:rhamnogalacturonan endolyase